MKAKIELEIDFDTESDEDVFPPDLIADILIKHIMPEASVLTSEDKKHQLFLHDYIIKNLTIEKP